MSYQHTDLELQRELASGLRTHYGLGPAEPTDSQLLRILDAAAARRDYSYQPLNDNDWREVTYQFCRSRSSGFDRVGGLDLTAFNQILNRLRPR
jgi:hypothetical protein